MILPKRPEASPIPDEVAIAALELVLKPLELRHAWDFSDRYAEAIEAMRGVLAANRAQECDQCADQRAAHAVEGVV